MRYQCDVLSPDEEEAFPADLEAVSDEQAIAGALQRFGDRLVTVGRAEASGSVQLVWEQSPIIPIKWAAEGAETVADTIAGLERLIGDLRGYEQDGLVLAQPVENGQIILRRP